MLGNGEFVCFLPRIRVFPLMLGKTVGMLVNLSTVITDPFLFAVRFVFRCLVVMSCRRVMILGNTAAIPPRSRDSSSALSCTIISSTLNLDIAFDIASFIDGC